MPNHLMSRLHFSGEQKRINELLESIKGEETLFDFNTIIPMPKSLNIEEGSRTDNGLKDYKDFITVYTRVLYADRAELEKEILKKFPQTAVPVEFEDDEMMSKKCAQKTRKGPANPKKKVEK